MNARCNQILSLVACCLLLVAPIPYTAPDGDLNHDGLVDVTDLQCSVLLFEAVEQGGEPGPDLCIPGDCLPVDGALTYCRPGFSGMNLCLPTCLHSQVSVGEAGLCADPAENSPGCLGLTERLNADLNCDGDLTAVDLVFMVSIILAKVGGPDTPDLDNDGALNFCDADSDGDTLPDELDPEPLVPLVLDCNDGKPCTADSQAMGQCVHTSLTGPACDDNDGCTTDDTCSAGSCAGFTKDCADSDVCTADSCVNGACQHALEPGPCQWPGSWILSDNNPVMIPTPSDGDEGADNIYAPDILKFEGLYWLWYGAQGGDGRDAIFLARSKDRITWQKHVTWKNPQPVVDHGNFNHVNDPSVVHVNGTFYMYYTGAPNMEDDRIYLATSNDGVNWSKQGMVLDVGLPDSWEPDRVGRPAVLYEQGQFRIWYDGQIFGVARHVGYATSPDGHNWTRHPANPVVLNEGAVDVDRVGQWYVMLAESGNGTKLYVAKDPVNWKYVGYLFNKSGQGYDAFGQVTPFLLVEGGQATGVYFGGASDVCWCKNRIGVAFPGADVAGCKVCLSGAASCQSACNGAGYSLGLCGAPGSADPSACCSCCNDWDCQGGGEPGCAGCVEGGDCNGACAAAGWPQGSCAHPGSTDPDACCACTDPAGCKGCLGESPDCATACQNAGYATGSCSNPGSTNPDACCTCVPYSNCQGCLVGHADCSSACQASGYSTGSCPNGSSADPDNWCECSYTNCAGCLAGYSDCNDACHHSGLPGGSCANSASTNPSQCCACSPDTGCEGCLGGHPNCMSACQAAGASGGWCGNPGSQNPGACCACF